MGDTRAAFEAFLVADEVDQVEEAFGRLLQATGNADKRGKGLELFHALKAAVVPTLNFKQKKLFQELQARLTKSEAVVANLCGEGSAQSSALVCGAGPVGLRVAVEAQMLGFNVTVVEKRNGFSRANILTFWAETMSDLLSFGARTYCPNIVTAGDVRHLGTREIQLVLLKDLLLFGGNMQYGREIFGLVPPAVSGGKWQGRFRPYVKGRRVAAAESQAAEETPEEQEARQAAEAAEDALDFKKAKEDEGTREKSGNKSLSYERPEPDHAFLAGEGEAEEEEVRVDFDAYFIAEGGWSDSTKKLGFHKAITQRKPTIGVVVNLKFNKDDPTERNMKSFLKHQMSETWPLQNCPVLAEFVEYLKGDTHFFALVCYTSNPMRTEKGLKSLEDMEASGEHDPAMIKQMRDAYERMGLIEMGVIKEKRPKAQLLAKDNVDAAKLHEMGRIIATDCGLPASTEFFHTNPVQIFDFSALARCELPTKILRGDGQVVGGTSEQADEAAKIPGSATVFPVGDALQEPLWTSGLGVNRGFHGGLNAVYGALLAREKGIPAAVDEVARSYSCMLDMQWGDGRLAGGGSGSSGVKPGESWTAEPRSRLPMK